VLQANYLTLRGIEKMGRLVIVWFLLVIHFKHDLWGIVKLLRTITKSNYSETFILTRDLIIEVRKCLHQIEGEGSNPAPTGRVGANKESVYR